MEHRSGHEPWGWDHRTRRVLGVVIVAVSALLFPREDPDSPPQAGSDLGLVVDLNGAPAHVLEALPRLGPALVGRIIAEREARPFARVDDLDARVRGIGPATVESLRPFLTVKSR